MYNSNGMPIMGYSRQGSYVSPRGQQPTNLVNLGSYHTGPPGPPQYVGHPMNVTSMVSHVGTAAAELRVLNHEPFDL